YSLYFNNTKLRVSVAKPVTRFVMGISLKYISYQYEKNDYSAINPDLSTSDMKSANIGLDTGIIYKIIENKIFAGLSVLNLNQPDMGLIGEDRLKLQAKGELGLKFSGFLLSAALQYYDKGISKLSLGAESKIISENFLLRMGFDNSFLPCLGFTVKIRQDPEAGIDYAVKFGDEVKNNNGSHYFTVFIIF
ncbi:MAG: type IX secretion system membrane protein PorP/SprF, partial [Spirochaetes bacterium]|nr:type IX secretion system membrane protein PorP/SprF [Spirochaetota bacterium]